MAVPKKRTSAARRDKRRSHLALSHTNTSTCPQCEALVLPHRICSSCGYYKGEERITVAE